VSSLLHGLGGGDIKSWAALPLGWREKARATSEKGIKTKKEIEGKRCVSAVLCACVVSFFLARMLIPAYPCSCGRFKNPNMKINVTTYFTSRSDITN
jgi:hypothetical protein